jgi:hypothetical protein
MESQFLTVFLPRLRRPMSVIVFSVLIRILNAECVLYVIRQRQLAMSGMALPSLANFAGQSKHPSSLYIH